MRKITHQHIKLCLGFWLFIAILLALFWAATVGFMTYGVITYDRHCNGAFYTGIVGLTFQDAALFFAGLGTDPNPSSLCLASADLIKALVGGSWYALLSSLGIVAALFTKRNKCVSGAAAFFDLPVLGFLCYTVYCLAAYAYSELFPDNLSGTTFMIPGLSFLTLVTLLVTISSACCCKPPRRGTTTTDAA